MQAVRQLRPHRLRGRMRRRRQRARVRRPPVACLHWRGRLRAWRITKAAASLPRRRQLRYGGVPLHVQHEGVCLVPPTPGPGVTRRGQKRSGTSCDALLSEQLASSTVPGGAGSSQREGAGNVAAAPLALRCALAGLGERGRGAQACPAPGCACLPAAVGPVAGAKAAGGGTAAARRGRLCRAWKGGAGSGCAMRIGIGQPEAPEDMNCSGACGAAAAPGACAMLLGAGPET